MADVAGDDRSPAAVRLPEVTLDGVLDIPADVEGLVALDTEAAAVS